ncbi:pyrimidine/purine nucleoside phosphorylase [Burkholderia gladioli]|uniref:Pyrimidine/purine nucleoside phosphorylase n=1 Tax=Burkholderia gladioli TaxID=28095 RepID=A0AB38TMV4_BURGA|nr:pyrimidine/purine nucleoside phosphorylase [Burkholderia gladioli]MBA1366105.1 pyrimidine/purine nucleoside phosphorylase [Burkholderia gladioli]MBU9191812.1 pyrimidine/purine nucleoside phosphorylase [Burkholderia gladioli]MBU9277621.1 pyrimidine/purine nucleoside phosphorylase [Burkholderia gladioli]MBU9319078.1 pyrimidine/purine nucleoside phosphorylase [Burkholderia gladioli]MBU9686825.1 pyrimidine/purine nucleoside phosphorylase [Burkholderia gladioli]
MKQYDKVSVLKTANIHFGGKCVSRLVMFPDGSRATLGVIFPSVLSFDVKRRETMEIIAGECRVKLAGSEEWRIYTADERFTVPAESSFEIEVKEMLEYVCHYH